MTKEQKLAAWEKASKIDGFNHNIWRKDCCGAWINYNEYDNINSSYGWHVDHIFPEATLQANKVPQNLIDAPINLRAMHWRNNNSKDNNYPKYKYVITSQDKTNVNKDGMRIVNENLQKSIKDLYVSYVGFMTSGELNWDIDDID